MNLIFEEYLYGLGHDDSESRLLFHFDLEQAERMDAEIKRRLDELKDMAKATGTKKWAKVSVQSLIIAIILSFRRSQADCFCEEDS